jgi:hypothetical protein
VISASITLSTSAVIREPADRLSPQLPALKRSLTIAPNAPSSIRGTFVNRPTPRCVREDEGGDDRQGDVPRSHFLVYRHVEQLEPLAAAGVDFSAHKDPFAALGRLAACR